MAETVRVNGLKELTRAFGAISQGLSDEVRDELLDAVEPVKDRAEQLALSRIRNMPASPDYAEMRTGVSKARGVVYMVPAWRTTRKVTRKRKAFAELMLSRAMEPALDENTNEIIRGLERTLDRLAGRNGF